VTSDAVAPPLVSAVVVASFEDPEVVRTTVSRLLDQTRRPDEILVVDNHPDAVVSDALEAARLPVRAIRSRRNLGYPPACNLAAQHATGDWLFFLNPDAVADERCVERLMAAADDATAIAGAQVLLPDGRTNAGDNPVHLTGLSWAGRYGQRREHGPPRDVAACSGAAVLIRRADFEALGGYHPSFFLYVDDTDLAWRARLAGRRVRFVPEAVVTHDYEFVKGPAKWYWLERNRLFMVLANYSAPALALLAPLLLGVEAFVAVRAWREGWLAGKVKAWRSVVRDRRDLLRWRRAVQAQRRVADRRLLAVMTGRMETPLATTPVLAVVNPLLERYRRMLLRVL
jgi:GT2 family glycosyltransferase